ncbi:hypothetical protein TIFTF001_018153 [Ficus carica]|uniref:RING-type domain-containing protein n=1 Tax=Ficus carica TaxID=3494 RepID=A0AA88AMK0_FICCA|nr:hypothetical protein TIFTF001_018153 [Ficus carica]
MLAIIFIDDSSPIRIFLSLSRISQPQREYTELRSIYKNSAGHHAGTPLHHAAKVGLVQTVELLLSSGANALVRNDDTQTPLDIARQNKHTDAVRAIEKHICYFSGWMRQFYGPSFLEALASYLLSLKIWVVVLPDGPDDPTSPRKLQLALYFTLQDAQPLTVVSLWKARIEEPNLSQSDPKLAVFDNTTKYRHRLASAIHGDKQQLQSLYNACRGISQVMPSSISHNSQSSVEGAEVATASSSDSIQSASAEISPAPDSHLIPKASSTNEGGPSVKDETSNRQGSAVGTTHSEADSTGCVDKQVKEDYYGPSTQDHEPRPHGRHASTPFHHAIKEGRVVEAFELFLSNRANALVRNDDGQTPLDVARQNRHTDLVRVIEIYGPGYLEALSSYLFSRKILLEFAACSWAVVIPHGPNDPMEPLKLELALYYSLKVKPPSISHNSQSSVEGAEVATASSSDSIQSASAEISPASDSHLIPEASSTNEGGPSVKDETSNGQGSAVGTTHSEPDCTGCVDKQVKEDYNGPSTQDHEPRPHGNQTKHSIGRHASTPLHHAIKEGRVLEAFELFLSNRGYALVRNDNGQTPLDVARQNQHTVIVRLIEKHICYFSGWVRQIYGPGLLEALSSYLSSRKILLEFAACSWIVVIPHGPNDPTEPLKLELALYYTNEDAQPFTVVSLWRARIEEPNLSQSDPKLIVFDDSTKYRHRLASAIQGDKQQLQSLFNACQGISQISSNVMRFPFSHSIQSSVEGTESATASSFSIQSASMEISLASNSHPITEASNTNGWGTSTKDDGYNGCGSVVGTSHSDPNSTGWVDEQVKEDYNGWSTHDQEPRPHGNQTKQSQASDESTQIVSENNNVSVSLSPAPSAPLLPEEILLEEPIHYPTIDLGSDTFSQPTNNEASASSCVICWEAPIEGACIPCGHMAGCMSCLTEIKSKKSVCPVCRSKITEVVRIYAV